MENQLPTGQAMVPVASQFAITQQNTGNSTATAHDGSIIVTPQITGVQRDVNITVNNTYVQSAATTDETVVSSNIKENFQNCQTELKSYLQHKTKNLFQGTKENGSSTSLNKIYTELYITEGGSGEVNTEHEVIELESTKCTSEERKIDLNDIFKPLSNEENPPQRVLMKGIAGIGKTVAVQKFTHDWAEGTANQTIQFLFPFTFRDLNLVKDKCWSLAELIGHCFDAAKDLKPSDYNSSRVLFIFDGLDESKLSLDFESNEMCCSVTKATTLDALLTSLIKGNLLYKALVWITSRPAAASKIPNEFIHRVTEVRGFNDEQKEEYFQKKILDKEKAQKILNHLQSKPLRSLYIMCHIPVFCWISATALQDLLKDPQKNELPKTVTEMYTHFLIIHTKRNQERKYQDHETDKAVITKLGKLAFEQLQNGNIIFSENDLKKCEIDLKQAAVFSGVCTQIIRKDSGLHRRASYSFIHLSFQEFLAALYVLEKFVAHGHNLIQSKVKVVKDKGNISNLLKSAVDMALASEYGQWDLFLRFLLGLSLEKNQTLLQKTFGFKGRCLQSSQETIKYIHAKIKKASYYEKSINLFQCLYELGDQSLVEQVQKYQSSGDVNKISSAHLSALAYVLLDSDEDLTVFDLKKYHKSDEALERLLPVFKLSKSALLSDCNLTGRCCRCISSVLTLKLSGLEELDLSRNNLQDSGIKPLCDGLKSPNCKLRKLELRSCNLSERSCEALASVFSCCPSSLRDLILSNNTFGDSGVKLLSAGMESQHCTLETLRLSGCVITEEGCTYLASALRCNSSHLRELDLSYNQPEDSGVECLSAQLVQPLCRLNTLRLSSCNLSTRSCEALASVLSSQSSSLRELDLSNNNLQDSGVNLLCAGLESLHCTLETLRLSGCLVTKEGCASLASALRSNPSHLKELDLSYNHPGDSEVSLLSAGQHNPQLTLNMHCGGKQRLKPDLRKWLCELEVDMNTIHNTLQLSHRTVTAERVKKRRPFHQDRFDYWHQFLCSNQLTGHHSWEVEWNGNVHIVVTYTGIRRKGCQNDSRFGFTDQSWSLCCSDKDGYSVRYYKESTDIDTSSVSKRVAVYVDYPAGILSFYTVCSDTLSHLHTFNTKFTEPLYPGFWIGSDSSVFLP